MENSNDELNRYRSSRTATWLASLVTAGALLIVFFYTPAPVIPVTHPYKAETVLAISVFIVLLIFRIDGISLKMIGQQLGGVEAQIATTIALFTVFSGISILWAASTDSVLHHTLLWGLYLTIFIIAYGITRIHGDLEFVQKTLGMTVSVIACVCLIDYLAVDDFQPLEGFLRIRYGKYGEMLVTIFPFFIGSALVSRGGKRWTFVTVAAFAWAAAMLSLSKGVFLAGLLGISVFAASALISMRSGAIKRIAVVALAFLTLTISFQLAFSLSSKIPSTTDYISGSADPTRASSEFRVLVWAVGLDMVKHHWMLGIGADNFGRAFNNGRIDFRQTSSRFSTMPEIGEEFLIERAHSEPLQVLSELGVVGLALFFAPFVIFGWAVFKRGAETDADKLILWAAIGGMAAFAVSSMVSSFSFRSAQNGAAFFFIFAAAVSVLRPAPNDAGNRRLKKALFAFGILSTILMLGYGASKAAAEYFVRDAESAVDNERAIADYKKALAIDPEYSGAYLSYAARFRSMGDFADAAKMTQKGIEHGIAMSLTYSELAKQRMAAGDAAGAEDAYREGVLVYPRSVYMQTEFALFLESIGKTDAAAEHLDIAGSIEPRQAKGWYHLIKDGGLKAFQLSQADPSIMPPAELPPTNATIQYSDNGPGDTPEATP